MSRYAASLGSRLFIAFTFLLCRQRGYWPANDIMTKPEPEPALSVSATPVPAAAAAKGLSAHILPTSATMIGVCMTVLSIGHLRPGGELRMVVDKLLAVDALVLLVSALLSFISMRSSRFGTRLEARAEVVFITGLGLLALGAVVLAFAIT